MVQRERRNDAYITDENKKKLSEILEVKKVVEGISFTVPNAEVIETGDWSITKYIYVDDSIELRPISEINKELKQLYKRLEELNAESSNEKLFS